jgi:hypothetical protein
MTISKPLFPPTPMRLFPAWKLRNCRIVFINSTYTIWQELDELKKKPLVLVDGLRMLKFHRNDVNGLVTRLGDFAHGGFFLVCGTSTISGDWASLLCYEGVTALESEPTMSSWWANRACLNIIICLHGHWLRSRTSRDISAVYYYIYWRD